jgi:hypothetical protein
MTEPIPWRYRPDSYMRGFVLGSATGAVAASPLTLFMLLTAFGVTSVVFALIQLAIFALGTYMWYHG